MKKCLSVATRERRVHYLLVRTELKRSKPPYEEIVRGAKRHKYRAGECDRYYRRQARSGSLLRERELLQN